MAIEGTRINLTKFLVAGGSRLNGLPGHVNEIKGKESFARLSIQAEKRDRAVHVVVLALLAMMTLAAGATLITLSGGPVALQLFAPGVMLCLASLSLTVWLSIVIARSTGFNKKMDQDLLELKNSTLSCETFLQEVQEENVTKEHVHAALKALPEPMRLEFMNWFLKHSNPKTYDKILPVFAKFPEQVALMDIEAMPLEFARPILHSIYRERVSKACMARLSSQVARHARFTDEDIQEMKTQPKEVVDFALGGYEKWSIENVINIFSSMNLTQQVEFLGYLKTRYDEIEKQHQQAPSELVPGSSEKIIELFDRCMHSVMDSDLETEANQALYAQLIQWSGQVAHFLFSSEKGMKILKNLEFMNKLWGDLAQDDFLAVAQGIIHDEDEMERNIDIIYQLVNDYGSQKLPDCIIELLKQCPQIVATVDIREFSLSIDLFKEVIEGMSVENQIKVFDFQLDQENSDFEPSNRLYSQLQCLEKERNNIANSSALAYFKMYPEAFRDHILLNEELGLNEANRYAFALDLLEHLDETAERVILMLDDNAYKGYPKTNYLTNLLVDELKGVAEISPERAKLAARFQYAPNAEVNRNKYTASYFSPIWNIKPQGDDWKNFLASAEEQKEAVWK